MQGHPVCYSDFTHNMGLCRGKFGGTFMSRKVWRDIARKSKESSSKLATYHSLLASPLPDLQADSLMCGMGVLL